MACSQTYTEHSARAGCMHAAVGKFHLGLASEEDEAGGVGGPLREQVAPRPGLQAGQSGQDDLGSGRQPRQLLQPGAQLHVPACMHAHA